MPRRSRCAWAWRVSHLCSRSTLARRRVLRGGGGARGLRRELDGDDLGDSRLLHRHAVERVGPFHGALVVRDDDELRAAAHLAHHLVVAADVGLVEGCVHLVEQAEGRGLDEEDGEDERDSRKRLLAAAQQIHAGQLFPRRLRDDLHARLAARRIVDELQLGHPAAEQAREHLLEALVDELERLLEALLRGAVDAADGRAQLGDRLLQVRLLRAEEVEALADFARLVDGDERDFAQRLDLLAQRLHARLGLCQIELQRLLAPRGRHVGQLHEVLFAHRLFQVLQLEPRPLQRQLRARAAFSDFARLFARLLHFLVAAAQTRLRLLVEGARPRQLIAQARRIGEELFQLLLRHLALGLQRGAALLALRDLGLQLLAPRLDFLPLLEQPLQRAGRALAPLGQGGRVHLGARHLGLHRLGALARFQQLGLQRAQPRLAVALLALAGGHRVAAGLLLARNLVQGMLQRLALVVQHLIALGDAAQLFLQPPHVALEAELRQLLLALLVHQPLHRRLGRLQSRRELLDVAGGLVQSRLQVLYLLRQLLHLAPLVQQAVGHAVELAAGDDAFLVHHLSVGRHEGALTGIARPERQRRGQRVAEADVAEQVVAQAIVLRRAVDHLDGAHGSFRRAQVALLGHQRQLLHLGERHERRAPLRRPAQIVDRLEPRRVALDDDELQPLAQHRLDGALVPRLDAQHVGDQPVDAVAPPLLLGAQHDGLHPAAVALEILLQLEQRGEPAASIRQLFAQLDELRIRLALLGAAPGQVLLGGLALLVQLLALVLRREHVLGQLVPLPRDLL